MEKTTKNGIHRITQAGGKTIAWAEESGVKVLEKLLFMATAPISA